MQSKRASDENERAGGKFLHVLIITDLYPPSVGGTETTTANLARGLAELGHNVTVIAPGSSWYRTYFEPGANPKVQILRIPSIRPARVAQFRIGFFPRRPIRAYLKRFSPDIIQVNSVYTAGLAGIRLAHELGFPLVVANHSMPEPFLYWLNPKSVLYHWLVAHGWEWLVRRYRHADVLVSPTATGLSYLQKGGWRGPVKAISNGVDIAANRPLDRKQDEVRAELGLADIPTIIYSGRLGVEKHVEDIIRAFAELHKRLECQLVVVGRGPQLPLLQGLAAKLGAADYVRFAGYIPNADKAKYGRASNLFVIASPFELQSIVTLEAMASGLPVVAVNAGALPELVRPGETGELFQTSDITGLASALEKVLTSPELQKRYSKQSMAVARTHDLKDMPAHYSQLYYEVLRGRS